MEQFECEYDRTKYFLDKNKNRIYATKGSGHKGLAYNIIHKIGLDGIYYATYENIVPAPVFLTYCGYVLVDEAQENYKLTFDSTELVTYKIVVYCSKAIDENYINYLKTTYESGDNIIDDNYETKDIKQKHIIDEIIEKVETINRHYIKQDEER